MKNPFSKTDANGTGPTFSTTCKFCERKIAQAPALDLPLIGSVDKRAQELQAILLKHVATKHPEQMAQGAAFLDEMMSFSILAAFDHEDPSIKPRLERIRAQIFQRVRKNGLNDADLTAIVESIGYGGDEAERIMQALQAVRDLLTETGRFSPANALPAPSPLIPTT